MKKNLTELVMILDRSGSMSGLENDTIGGYNGMLKKQRETKGEVLVSTVLFDHNIEVLHDRVPLDKVPAITEKDYYVRGSTALLDAVGRAIHHIGTIHKYAREEDRPEKTIFVITTDGMENLLQYKHTLRDILRTEWGFDGFVVSDWGANIDAVATAGRFGISADRAVNYHSDRKGTKLNYEVLADAVSDMRCCASRIDAGWKKRIEDDFEKRGKKNR